MGVTTVRIVNDRFYRLYIPDGIAADAPLVITPHPGLSNAETWQNTLGLDAVADAAPVKFMVAYPYGVGFVYDGNAIETWNSGAVTPDGRVISGRAAGLSYLLDFDDVDFMKRMLSQINNDESIDLGRVYFAGFSNGGHLSYSYTAIYPDDVRAVTIFNGALMMDYDNVSSAINVPIWHVFSTEDTIVPAGGYTPPNTLALLYSGVVPPMYEFAAVLQSKGADYTFFQLTGATHFAPSINAYLTSIYGYTMATLIGQMVQTYT